MADPGGDRFSAARANLRDLVKYIAGALAGVAALTLGTTPFTALGSLTGARLIFALLALGAALAAFLGALGIVLELLFSDLFFLEQAAADPDLQAFLDQHAADLLPPELPNFNALLAARAEAAAAIRAAGGLPAIGHEPGVAYGLARKRYNALTEQLPQITSLLHLRQFQRRFLDALAPLWIYAASGAAALVLYGWLANPSKPASAALHGSDGAVSAAKAP